MSRIQKRSEQEIRDVENAIAAYFGHGPLSRPASIQSDKLSKREPLVGSGISVRRDIQSYFDSPVAAGPAVVVTVESVEKGLVSPAPVLTSLTPPTVDQKFAKAFALVEQIEKQLGVDSSVPKEPVQEHRAAGAPDALCQDVARYFQDGFAVGSDLYDAIEANTISRKPIPMLRGDIG